MRKFYFILMALFCATALFTGCSDDDDDKKGNGQGAGNGGSGVEVLSRKIARMVVSYSDEDHDNTFLFAYDTKGRLSKITEIYGSNSSGDVTDFTYGDDKITITADGNKEASVIQLKDGRAASFVEYDGTNYRLEYTYSYAGKYLSKAICKDFVKFNSEWKEDGSGISTFTVKDGNLVSLNYVYTYEGGTEENESTLEMSNVNNNTNIDLYGMIMDEKVFLLCVAGDRYQKLPAKVTTKEEGGKDNVTVYSYEVDKEGYITKFTMTEADGYKMVYTITYE